MSIGRLVRFVKKWLKKDNDCGLYEEEEDEDEEEEEEEEEEEGQRALQLTAEPCVFCDAARSCGRDLNRNLHISSSSSSSSHQKMGFPTDKSGDCYYYYYDLPDSASVYPPPSPFHCTARATPFASTVFSDRPSCRSSRSPVPVCVCEACRLFASSNLHRTSAMSSRRTTGVAPAAAASGCQSSSSAVGKGSDERSCPSRRNRVDVSSRLAPGRSGASKPGGATTETASRIIGCNEDGSHLPTSTARHSASVERRLGADDAAAAAAAAAAERHLAEEQTTGQNPADHLPVSVARSFDGEEGYTSAQRHLHCRNQRYGAGVQWRFCPPPNKTICHVGK